MKRIGLFLVLFMFLFVTAVYAHEEDTQFKPMDDVVVKFLANHYKVDKIVVISLHQRMVLFEDDTSVALYLAKLADMDPMKILPMRLSGNSWAKVMEMNNIAPKKLFVNLPDKKDMGHRFAILSKIAKDYAKDPNCTPELSDNNVRDMVQLKLLNSAFNMKYADIINKVNSGKSYSDIIKLKLGK